MAGISRSRADVLTREINRYRQILEGIPVNYNGVTSTIMDRRITEESDRDSDRFAEPILLIGTSLRGEPYLPALIEEDRFETLEQKIIRMFGPVPSGPNSGPGTTAFESNITKNALEFIAMMRSENVPIRDFWVMSTGSSNLKQVALPEQPNASVSADAFLDRQAKNWWTGKAIRYEAGTALIIEAASHAADVDDLIVSVETSRSDSANGISTNRTLSIRRQSDETTLYQATLLAELEATDAAVQYDEAQAILNAQIVSNLGSVVQAGRTAQFADLNRVALDLNSSSQLRGLIKARVDRKQGLERLVVERTGSGGVNKTYRLGVSRYTREEALAAGPGYTAGMAKMEGNNVKAVYYQDNIEKITHAAIIGNRRHVIRAQATDAILGDPPIKVFEAVDGIFPPTIDRFWEMTPFQNENLDSGTEVWAGAIAGATQHDGTELTRYDIVWNGMTQTQIKNLGIGGIVPTGGTFPGGGVTDGYISEANFQSYVLDELRRVDPNLPAILADADNKYATTPPVASYAILGSNAPTANSGASAELFRNQALSLSFAMPLTHIENAETSTTPRVLRVASVGNSHYYRFAYDNSGVIENWALKVTAWGHDGVGTAAQIATISDTFRNGGFRQRDDSQTIWIAPNTDGMIWNDGSYNRVIVTMQAFKIEASPSLVDYIVDADLNNNSLPGASGPALNNAGAITGVTAGLKSITYRIATATSGVDSVAHNDLLLKTYLAQDVAGAVKQKFEAYTVGINVSGVPASVNAFDAATVRANITSNPSGSTRSISMAGETDLVFVHTTGSANTKSAMKWFLSGDAKLGGSEYATFAVVSGKFSPGANIQAPSNALDSKVLYLYVPTLTQTINPESSEPPLPAGYTILTDGEAANTHPQQITRKVTVDLKNALLLFRDRLANTLMNFTAGGANQILFNTPLSSPTIPYQYLGFSIINDTPTGPDEGKRFVALVEDEQRIYGEDDYSSQEEALNEAVVNRFNNTLFGLGYILEISVKEVSAGVYAASTGFIVKTAQPTAGPLGAELPNSNDFTYMSKTLKTFKEERIKVSLAPGTYFVAGPNIQFGAPNTYPILLEYRTEIDITEFCSMSNTNTGEFAILGVDDSEFTDAYLEIAFDYYPELPATNVLGGGYTFEQPEAINRTNPGDLEYRNWLAKAYVAADAYAFSYMIPLGIALDHSIEGYDELTGLKVRKPSGVVGDLIAAARRKSRNIKECRVAIPSTLALVRDGYRWRTMLDPSADENQEYIDRHRGTPDIFARLDTRAYPANVIGGIDEHRMQVIAMAFRISVPNVYGGVPYMANPALVWLAIDQMHPIDQVEDPDSMTHAGLPAAIVGPIIKITQADYIGQMNSMRYTTGMIVQTTRNQARAMISDAPTLAGAGSQLDRQLVVKTVNLCINHARFAMEPFIGKPREMTFLNGAQTAAEQAVVRNVGGKLLRSFNLKILPSETGAISGRDLVKMHVQTVRDIRGFDIVTSLGFEGETRAAGRANTITASQV